MDEELNLPPKPLFKDYNNDFTAYFEALSTWRRIRREEINLQKKGRKVRLDHERVRMKSKYARARRKRTQKKRDEQRFPQKKIDDAF